MRVLNIKNIKIKIIIIIISTTSKQI